MLTIIYKILNVIGSWQNSEYMMMSKNLDDDDTLLLLVEILEEVEEFFLNSFFVDILVDKLQ